MKSHPPEWHLEQHGRTVELLLTGDWIANETGIRSAADVRRILDEAGEATLQLNASDLGQWDSALIALVRMLRDLAATGSTQPTHIDDSGLPDAARRLLSLAVAGGPEAADREMRHPSLATRVGVACFDCLSEAVEVAFLVGEMALRGTAAFGRRTHTRAVDIFELVREAGVGALGIVALVNGLVGGIIAFVGAVQLRRLGAGIYVADLVGVAMVREMAPLMTAIIMSGRTGGAYAAHIATMQGNEEIDALRVIGIPVNDYLVLPRIAGADRHDAAAVSLWLRGRRVRRTSSSRSRC